MIKLSKYTPVLRAVGVIGVVAGLATAVTFAALTSNTVALDNNELDVTSDVLRISNGGAFATSVTGFNNPNLVVGVEGPMHAFYLQNLAVVNLSLCSQIPGTPTFGLDLTKVDIKFYDQNSAPLSTYTVAQLAGGCQTIADQLNAFAQGNGSGPTEGNYFYSVKVNPGAVIGGSPSIPSFTLQFTGTEI